MSAQLNLNASQYESTGPEPRVFLGNWPLPGWRMVASPATLRYLRLQQRAEHWENRHFDLAIHLRKWNAEQEKGIDPRAKITRLERLTDRAGLRANALLGELFAEGDRLRGVSARTEMEEA